MKKISVSIFRKTSTLLMPVAGTLESVPEIDQISKFQPDSFEGWAERLFVPTEIRKNETRTRVSFTTSIFLEEYTKLARELDEREASLKSFLSADLSSIPVEDPFSIASKRDVFRIKDAQETLVSLLWSEKIAAIANDVPDEKYPTLEMRVNPHLSDETIRFCSSAIALSESDTRLLARYALALKIREHENVPPDEWLRRYERVHPSALTQVIKINDPVLYGKHTVFSSVEDFQNSYLEFDELARKYWQSLSERKLYMAQDIAALKKWGIISAANGIGTGADPGGITPIEKLDKARTEWFSTKKEIDRTQLIMNKIGSLGMELTLRGQWPPLADVGFNERSAWLARQAVSILNAQDQDDPIPGEYAAGHALTWDRLGRYIFQFFKMDFLSAIEGGPSDTQTRLAAFTQIIVPEAVGHLMSRQMEFRMRDVYGGTTLRFNYPSRLDFEIEDSSDVGPEPLAGTKLKNEFLKNPRAFDQHMKTLKDWRTAFEGDFAKRTMILRQVASLNSVLEYYRDQWESISAEAEEIRGMLINAERIVEIKKIIDAMLSRLDSPRFGAGGIDIPVDSRIVSVFASVGEHLNEGFPVVSVRERFRCAARSFAAPEEIAELGISAMSVWKINFNEEVDLTPELSYICIVKGVEPTEQNVWTIEMEILAALKLGFEEISNTPEFLPLSTRYLDPVAPGITEEILNTVEQNFSGLGLASVTFVKRIQ